MDKVVKTITLKMSSTMFRFNREVCEELNGGPIYIPDDADTVTFVCPVVFNDVDRRSSAFLELIDRGYFVCSEKGGF